MKKIIMFLSVILLVGCGSINENGELTTSEYIGKFKGNSIYMLITPDGESLYIAVKNDNEITSIESTTGVKHKPHHYTIMIDGKEVTKEEAKEILGE